MTHDQIVQFAAGKIGAFVENQYGEPLDLASPDLMLKGMEAARKQGYFMHLNTNMKIISIFGMSTEYPEQMSESNYKEFGYTDITDIPLIFWQCWCELEKG